MSGVTARGREYEKRQMKNDKRRERKTKDKRKKIKGRERETGRGKEPRQRRAGCSLGRLSRLRRPSIGRKDKLSFL